MLAVGGFYIPQLNWEFCLPMQLLVDGKTWENDRTVVNLDAAVIAVWWDRCINTVPGVLTWTNSGLGRPELFRQLLARFKAESV